LKSVIRLVTEGQLPSDTTGVSAQAEIIEFLGLSLGCLEDVARCLSIDIQRLFDLRSGAISTLQEQSEIQSLWMKVRNSMNLDLPAPEVIRTPGSIKAALNFLETRLGWSETACRIGVPGAILSAWQAGRLPQQKFVDRIRQVVLETQKPSHEALDVQPCG
jgi:hypothetical protein